MKITKSQLKEIIKEEVSRLQKKTILENRKKEIVRELGMLSENEDIMGLDPSIFEPPGAFEPETSYKEPFQNNMDMEIEDEEYDYFLKDLKNSYGLNWKIREDGTYEEALNRDAGSTLSDEEIAKWIYLLRTNKVWFNKPSENTYPTR